MRKKTKEISRQCVTKMFEVATPTFEIMYIVLLSLRQVTSHLTLSQSIFTLVPSWLAGLHTYQTLQWFPFAFGAGSKVSLPNHRVLHDEASA